MAVAAQDLTPAAVRRHLLKLICIFYILGPDRPQYLGSLEETRTSCDEAYSLSGPRIREYPYRGQILLLH